MVVINSAERCMLKEEAHAVFTGLGFSVHMNELLSETESIQPGINASKNACNLDNAIRR